MKRWMINLGSGLFTAAIVAAGVTLAANAITTEQLKQEADLLAQQTAEFEEARHCLAMNIYHEARSESKLGKRAVAWVTMNRVSNKKFPDTICDVVYQAHVDSNGNPKRHQCQFSWYCDGQSDKINNQDEWNSSVAIAQQVMTNFGKIPDPTDGATYYHAVYVNPDWASHFTRTARIDNHVFYRK